MPITPASPYPKSPGDPIRAADWNQAVNEAIRLDNDKLDRAGDRLAGDLVVDGSLSVDVVTAQAKLHVSGGQGDLGASEGDLKIGNAAFRLKMGVAIGPGVSGDARIRAQGGTNRLMLGTGTADVLTLRESNVGVRVDAPNAPLHLAGGNWNPDASEGDLKIGNDTHRLKIGVATGGGGAGDVRIRAQGGTNRLILGAAANDVLSVHNDEVGVGTITPYTRLTVNGSIGFTNATTPMLYIFQSGTSNPERPVIAHSPSFPTWGLSYRDSDDVMVFQRQGDPVLSVDLGGRAVHVDANARLFFANQTRQMVNLWSDDYGIGVQSSTTYFRSGNHFAWYRGGAHNDGALNPGGGTRTMYLTNAGNLFISGGGFKPGGGLWASSSDIRLKKNVATLEHALDDLLRLRGVTFEWKDPAAQGGLEGAQMGLVAQEVEEVFPEWVGTDPDGDKYVAVRGLEALVVEALRELHERIRRLEDGLDALQTRVNNLAEGS